MICCKLCLHKALLSNGTLRDPGLSLKSRHSTWPNCSCFPYYVPRFPSPPGYRICVCPSDRMQHPGQSLTSRTSWCPHCWPLCWPGGTAATPGRGSAAGVAGPVRARPSKPPRHRTAGGILWLGAAPPGHCSQTAAPGGSGRPPGLCGCHLCPHPLQARAGVDLGSTEQSVPATLALTSEVHLDEISSPRLLISHERFEIGRSVVTHGA